MKKIILTLFICQLNLIVSYAQEKNNNHQYDDEDLTNVFEEIGINVFKFPLMLEKGEYISMSYKIYDEGELIAERNFVEDIQIEEGITFNHHFSRKDTLIEHRLYFFKKEDSLKIKMVIPGLTGFNKIDISSIGQSSFSDRIDIINTLPEKKRIDVFLRK